MYRSTITRYPKGTFQMHLPPCICIVFINIYLFRLRLYRLYFHLFFERAFDFLINTSFDQRSCSREILSNFLMPLLLIHHPLSFNLSQIHMLFNQYSWWLRYTNRFPIASRPFNYYFILLLSPMDQTTLHLIFCFLHT